MQQYSVDMVVSFNLMSFKEVGERRIKVYYGVFYTKPHTYYAVYFSCGFKLLSDVFSWRTSFFQYIL